MTDCKAEEANEGQAEHVTYVVVVHGIGEQRKNECVINVVNRFAEARRGAEDDDNRDVLTLGKASGQTGWSKAPGTEQPWMEFKDIPATPLGDGDLPPFLGEPANCGTNLRFVDLCWSDVMQDSVEHVGQDVDLWAKGLLGRLLRKHEAAKTDKQKVPLWIRRTLYLLADTLLLVRFAMNFRFKEMKDLIFVKFLSDVELYGEYSRCRGQAVRRFHEIMAKVEAAHNRREKERERRREARYVVIAHSLGSIMSLDALLYASATPGVRRGDDVLCGDDVPCSDDDAWVFPGYLRDDDEESEPDELARLDGLRKKSRRTGGALSENEDKNLHELEAKFAFLDTRWIERVDSFVTLGSPIDKYLTIWWLNYRYLRKCKDRLLPRPRKINHFNYCDELDPVGHKLDVVQQTPVYEAMFDGREDVVFNRYSTPGIAHNGYWTDQTLFRWILHWAVDKDNAAKPPKEPRWFRPGAYWKLLYWLYSLLPLTVLLGTYGSLSLVFQANGWRTAVVAAAVFSFLIYFGSRLIDLGIWWRQVQRQKSSAFWRSRRPTKQERTSRKAGGVAFWCLAFAVPLACVLLTYLASREFSSRVSEAHGPLWSTALPPCSSESCAVSLLVVLAVFVGVGLFVASRRLPVAYRVPALGLRHSTKVERASMFLSAVATMVLLLLIASRFACPSILDAKIAAESAYRLPTPWLGHLALFGIVATAVYVYRLYRFLAVKYILRPGQPDEMDYNAYASGASRVDDA